MDRVPGNDSPSVYHAPADEAIWAAFGRAVLRQHPAHDDGRCACGHIRDVCPVIVQARQHRLPVDDPQAR